MVEYMYKLLYGRRLTPGNDKQVHGVFYTLKDIANKSRVCAGVVIFGIIELW